MLIHLLRICVFGLVLGVAQPTLAFMPTEITVTKATCKAAGEYADKISDQQARGYSPLAISVWLDKEGLKHIDDAEVYLGITWAKLNVGSITRNREKGFSKDRITDQLIHECVATIGSVINLI
jgi:hypothetical protein